MRNIAQGGLQCTRKITVSTPNIETSGFPQHTESFTTVATSIDVPLIGREFKGLNRTFFR